MSELKNRRIVKEPEIRRMEIVAAATRLFLERGYERTSTNDVMKALNIAKGTIYHYFPSKEKLMEAVVDHMAEEYVARRLEAVEAEGGDALRRIEVLFTNDRREEGEMEATDHLHKEDNVRLHTRLLAVLVEKLGPVFGDLIRRGCEEGLLETAHPEEAAELLLAGIQFLTDEGVFPWDEKAVARRMKAYPSIMETLLKAKPGSFDWLARSGGEKNDG